MPWENDPNNSQNSNPWGRRPGRGPRPVGGGGPDQPDLDGMLRKAQASMKDMMPGDFGNGKLIGFGLVALTGLWLASGFFIVQPGEQAVIQRFGKWTKTQTEAGLGYHFPAPVETVTKVNVAELRTMSIGFVQSATRGSSAQAQDLPEESLMLTSDRNIVDLDLVIQWDLKSAEDFIFNIQDPENTVKKVAESAIREVVGQTNMFSIITTQRETVAQKAKTIIQANLDEYKAGVNVRQVLIQQAEVHPEVQSAFQDVQSAKQDAEDVQNRAQAYREDIIPRARGEAIRMIQEAQAYKQSQVAKATGDAERFNAVYQAYLSGEDVTKQRIYIETMENVLQNATKIILDDNGKQGVVPYLPLNDLKKSTKPEQTPQPAVPEAR